MPLLYIECPCTSFPRSFARDYKETYRYPPPSTLYGFLLSLVGEIDLMAHVGVKLAIGLIGDELPVSRIVRKQRHHKHSSKGLGTYPTSIFSIPNYQELITDLKVVVRLDSTEELAPIKLSERVEVALASPNQITRFGALSLGESWAMINGIRAYVEDDGLIRWLVKDNRGLIGLPIWIDRNISQGTFQRFSLGEFEEACWVTIQASTPTQPSKTKRTRK